MFENDARIVEDLLSSNDGFRRLHDKHQSLKQRVHDAIEDDALDDQKLGALKKEKLLAKDQMAAMIEDYRRTHS